MELTDNKTTEHTIQVMNKFRGAILSYQKALKCNLFYCSIMIYMIFFGIVTILTALIMEKVLPAALVLLVLVVIVYFFYYEKERANLVMYKTLNDLLEQVNLKIVQTLSCMKGSENSQWHRCYQLRLNELTEQPIQFLSEQKKLHSFTKIISSEMLPVKASSTQLAATSTATFVVRDNKQP